MRGYVAWTVLAVGAIVGCQPSVPSTGSADAPAGVPAKAGASKLSPEGVNLVIGDEKKLAEMVAAHKGRVVFVDFWATWCEPCVAYFPHTVEIHRQYQERGLATIAVSYDTLEEESKARKFLADQGADFENLLSSYDGAGTGASEGFQIGQVPHFRLYDRQGKLRHKWDNKPVEVEQKIEELLAEKDA